MASNDAAGRWLALLVGSVVAAGAACLAWAVGQVSLSDPLAFPVVMSLLVAVAGTGAVMMRIRSQHLLTTTTAAVLAAVVVLPAGWAVLCTAAGFAVAKAVRRQAPHKAAFNTAKETLACAAAAAAAQAVGMVPASQASAPVSAVWASYLLGLCAAALAYAVVDEVVPVPVIALASRTPWRQVARRDLDIRTATRAVDLALAAAAVVLAVVDLRLLVLIPAAMAVTYLAYAYRLRLREERRAWQQLAAATDALAAAGGTGDLTRVLHTAITGTARLFPAAQVDIELQPGQRLVRGDQDGIGYDGPAAQAPPAGHPASEVTLAAPDGVPAGVLRLRFDHAPATLADREPFLLHTLAPHLATALRNTTAYATAVTLAERNAHDATHDPLTDLPNRRSLHEHLATLLAAAGRGQAAAMLVDLDHFKEVNDTIGHPAGDQVLVEVARRLYAAARGALVARLGGDEFAVVLQEPTATMATLRAEQVLAALCGPMDLHGVPTSLDASAGLAIATDTITSQELLRRADVALYQAKGLGQPVRLAVYQPTLDHPGSTLALRAHVPKAVATDQWTLTFEPIVDLASGRVVAAEALPHWELDPARDPQADTQPLPTARLLGMLQRSGLLNRFIDRMLDRALAAASDWHRSGFDIAVTVNLTPRGIAMPGFPSVVLGKLSDHRLDPRLLTIELTQTAGLGHTPPVDRHLAALRAAGVRIALDGFGTGHSTLAALYTMAVDEIKIDRGFVVDLLSAAKAVALVSSIVELGRRFDLLVTAEGVEQERQRQALWEIGCNAGQGRLFGAARASSDLLAAVQRGHGDQPGLLCTSLAQDATVIRMPMRPVVHSVS